MRHDKGGDKIEDKHKRDYRERLEDLKEACRHRRAVFPYGFRHPKTWDAEERSMAVIGAVSLYVLLRMP